MAESTKVRTLETDHSLTTDARAASSSKGRRPSRTMARRRRAMDALRHARDEAEQRAALLGAKLDRIEGSRTWRFRGWLVSVVQCIPGLGKWRREGPPISDCDGWETRSSFASREEKCQVHPRQHTADRMPKVSVVIVNYNGLEHLPGCLKSLWETDYPDFDVTLVDNGSSDKSVEWVLGHYPQVNILCSPENLGFGRANHLGILQCDAPVIVLLNNDTEVHRDWLWPLVEPLVDDDRLAATSSKLRFLQQPRVLNGVGGGMNRLGLSYDLGIHEVDDGQRDEPREVLFPCGAACAVRRSAFEAVGGFDEAFFMYHEDVDLGWRLRLLGYSIRTAPQSIVYHRFGGTSRKTAGASFREEMGLRHDLRTLLKNYQWSTLCRVLPLFFLFLLKTACRTRSLGHFRCLTWNLAHLRDTLRQRKDIQRRRQVSDRELAPLIFPHSNVPCCMPDYEPIDRDAFIKSGRRKSWIGMADRRWDQLGHGWHFVESFGGDPRVLFRWTQREAVVFLWSHQGRGALELEVLGNFVPTRTPRVFEVSINDRPAKRVKLHGTDWQTIRVPYDGPPGPLELTIRVENPWLPGRLFQNNDLRELGIGVRRIQFVPSTDQPQQWDGLSVVIPTYNRCDKLLKVLLALERQSLGKDRFEVIVVDDGSTDATRHAVAAFRETSRLRLTYAHQQNKLQGAARNHGITLAREPLVLFLGDDIVPTPDLLEQHLAFHRRHNPCGDVAVVGRIQWDDDLRPTPFMHYVNDRGAQFGFALMDHAGPWQFDCFYTSNLSVPRQLLERDGYVFDEDFKQYGWEDAELGYRLEREGMRLLYNAEALACHDHSTTVLQFCRRQRGVGQCSRLFVHKHPELESHLGSVDRLRRRAGLRPLWIVAAWATALVDGALRTRLPGRWYAALLSANYAQGVLQGQAADASPPNP